MAEGERVEGAVPYSDRMKKLIEDPDKLYKPMVWPSGHDIGAGFAKDNGGTIPSNPLPIPNTESNGAYVFSYKLIGAALHPARSLQSCSSSSSAS
ncbi:MAG: hypothetical protein ACK4YM_04700 [Novosphingobium sp.]